MTFSKTASMVTILHTVMIASGFPLDIMAIWALTTRPVDIVKISHSLSRKGMACCIAFAYCWHLFLLLLDHLSLDILYSVLPNRVFSFKVILIFEIIIHGIIIKIYHTEGTFIGINKKI